MSIEEKIFKRTVIDFSALPGYGFEHSAQGWVCTKEFMNGDFKAVITIDEHGKVAGEVYETDSNDVYLPLRVDEISSGFVGEVRGEYMRILEDIKQYCCHTNYFTFPQSNRLTRKIFARYGDSPEFPWEKYSDCGVFRNPDSRKWYALIMNISKSWLDKKLSGDIEIVNLKLDADKIPELHKQTGFYPAYHMNKKSWITITLDDSVPDEVLLALVAESHEFTIRKKPKSKRQ